MKSKAAEQNGKIIIMDHIIEQQTWLDELVQLLVGYDVFFVGVHCSVEELERRERARGDRRVDDARKDLAFVHAFGPYDLEIDAENPLQQNVDLLIQAWQTRQRPNVFEKLAVAID